MTTIEVVAAIAALGWVLAIFAAVGWMDAMYRARETAREVGAARTMLKSAEAQLIRRAKELDDLDRIVKRGLEMGARAADDAELLRDYMKGARR